MKLTKRTKDGQIKYWKELYLEVSVEAVNFKGKVKDVIEEITGHEDFKEQDNCGYTWNIHAVKSQGFDIFIVITIPLGFCWTIPQNIRPMARLCCVDKGVPVN